MISICVKKKLKGFNGFFELDINEKIPEKSFIGIFGNSGSGKSTFLEILSGFIKPDYGEISFNNTLWLSKTINLSPFQRNIGYVYQSDVLFEHFSILENLNFACTDVTNTNYLKELIKEFNLENLLNLRPSQLSGGQKQLVCLIRAIIRKPPILLLDEPLSSVDYTLRKKLQKLILKIHNDLKITCIIVSHDPNELKYLTDTIWKIEQGKIIEKGDFETVLGNLI